MANVINLHFNATANFGQVQSQIAALTAEMNKLNATAARSGGFAPSQIAAMRAAESQFTSTIQATRAFKVETVQLATASEQLTQRFVRGRFSLGEYFGMMRRSLSGVVPEINKVAMAQAQLQNAMVLPSATKSGMATMITNLGVMGKASAYSKYVMQGTNTLWRDGSTALLNLGKNTQWAGRQLMVGFTVPVLAAGAALAAMFYQVDKNLTMLQRVYGIGGQAGGQFQNVLPSEKEIQNIRGQIIDLSKELARMYGTSASETTKVASSLAAAGYTQQQLLDMTRTAVKAMALGDTDMQSSIKAAISLQNTYKISVGEVGNAMNFLSSVQASTSTNMNDLIDSIPRVGPVVKNLGGSYKDLVALIVSMKEGGVSAGEGANAIKTSMQRLVSPTKAAQQALAGFGIDIKSIVNANAGNLIGTITELQIALERLSPLARQQALTELFGKYQASRMSALFENFNKSGTQSAKVMAMQKLGAKELADIAKHETEQIQQTGSGGFKIAVETLKADLLPIGEQFLTIMTKIVNAFDKFIKVLKIFEPYKNILLGVLGGVAIAGPILMLSGLFMNLVAQAIKGISKLFQFITGFRSALSEGNSFFQAINGGFANLNNYLEEIDKTMLASEKLADQTKSATMGQAEAISILTHELNNYLAAINRLNAAGGAAGFYGRGGAAGGASGGATGGGPSGSGGGAGGAQAALAAAAWRTMAPNQNAEGFVQSKSEAKQLYNTNSIGTVLIGGALKKYAEQINSSNESYGMNQKFIAETQKEEIEMRRAALQLLIDKNGLSISENDKQAIINKNMDAIPQKWMTIAEVLNNTIVSMDQWTALEARHLAAMKIVSELDIENQKQLQLIIDSYRTQIGPIKDQNVIAEKSAEFAAKINQFLVDKASLIEEGVTYETVYNETLNEINQLAKSGLTQAEIHAKLIAQDVIQKQALLAMDSDLVTATDNLGAAIRLSAQQMEGFATSLKLTTSGATDKLRFHLSQQAPAFDALSQSPEGQRLLDILAGLIEALNTNTKAQEEGIVESRHNTTAEHSNEIATEENTAAITENTVIEEELVAEGAGKSGGMLGGKLGKVGGGLMMAGMMAPMLTEPAGKAVGGAAGGAISGAGQGLMYGTMAGMAMLPIPVVGEIAAVAAPIIGAAVGGIKGYMDKANEMARQAEEERANIIKSSYNVSGQAIDAFALKMNNFASVHLSKANTVMDLNQQIVDKLAESYKNASDQQTKDYLTNLHQERFGKPQQEASWWQTAGANPFGRASMLSIPGIGLPMALAAQKFNYGEVGGLMGPEAAQKADLKKYQRGLNEKFWSDTLAGMTGTQATNDVLAVAKSVGDEGFGVTNLTSKLSAGLKDKIRSAQAVAFQSLLRSAIGSNGELQSILSQGFVSNIGGSYAGAKGNWTDIAKSRGVTSDEKLNAITHAQEQYNAAIDATTSALTNAINSVDPSKFFDLSKGATEAQTSLMFSEDAFSKLKDQVANSNPELAAMMQTLHDSDTPIRQIYAALNLMNSGLIHTQEQLMATAQSLNAITGLQAVAAQNAAIAAAQPSAAGAGATTAASGVGATIAGLISQSTPSSSGGSGGSGGGGGGGSSPKKSSGGGGGSSGPTPEETNIQNQIDAKNAYIEAVKKEIAARQKLYDAKQKQREQDQALQNLQNNIFKARATGSLLDIAAAQSAYNDELKKQAELRAKEKADARDEAKIQLAETEIKALQKELEKLKKAASAAAAGAGSAAGSAVGGIAKGAGNAVASANKNLDAVKAKAAQAAEDLKNMILASDGKVGEVLKSKAGAQKIAILHAAGITDAEIQKYIVGPADKANPFNKPDFLKFDPAAKAKFHTELQAIHADVKNYATQVELANMVAKIAPNVDVESTKTKMDDLDALLAQSGFTAGTPDYEKFKKDTSNLFGFKYVDVGETEKTLNTATKTILESWKNTVDANTGKPMQDAFTLSPEDARTVANTYGDALSLSLGPAGAAARALDKFKEIIKQKVASGVLTPEQGKQAIEDFQKQWDTAPPLKKVFKLEPEAAGAAAGKNAYAGYQSSPKVDTTPPEMSGWEAFVSNVKEKLTEIGSWFQSTWSGVTTWFQSTWKTVFDWFQSTWNNISSSVKGIWDSVSSWFKNTWDTAANWLHQKWDGVVSWFTGIWNSALNAVSKFIKEHLIDPIANFAKPIIENINGVLKTIAAVGIVIYRLLKKAWDAIYAYVDKHVIQPIKDKWNEFTKWFNAKVIQPIKDKWNEITTWFYNAIVQPIKDKWNQFVTWFDSHITGMIRKKWQEFTKWVNDHVINPIKNFWKNFPTWFNEHVIGLLKNKWQELVTWIDEHIIKKIQDLWQSIVNWIDQNVIQPIKDKWNEIVTFIDQKIIEPIKSLWDGFTTWFGQNIIDPIESMWDKLTSWFDKNVTQPLKDAWTSIVQFWSDWKTLGVFQMADKIEAWITNLPNKIGGMKDAFATQFTSVWNNFWNILTGPDGIATKVTNWINDLPNKITGIKDKVASAFSGVWSGMTSAFKTEINNVITVWNSWADQFRLPDWTLLGNAAGQTLLPHINLQFASGGYISGPGGPKDDVIPALLSNGEYVIQASSVQKYGKGILDEINAGKYKGEGDVFRKFASGGINDISSLLKYSDTLIGTPYNFSEHTGKPDSPQNGFGCSPFISYIMDAAGVSLPAYSPSQLSGSQHPISKNDAKVGDLIFWYWNEKDPSLQHNPNHVGMLHGNGQMIDSAGGRGVDLTSLSGDYSVPGPHFTDIGRVLPSSFYQDTTVTGDNMKYWDNFINIMKETAARMNKDWDFSLIEKILHPVTIPPAFSNGGMVDGDKTKIDSIKAMLSAGEYVVKQKAVTKYGQHFLDLINSGNLDPRVANPRSVSNFNPSAAQGSAIGASTNIEYNINVAVEGSNASPDDIAKVVLQTLKRKEATKITHRNIG